jgi:hypothetical protein
MSMSQRGTKVVIGSAAMAMGIVLLGFVPVTTIRCHRAVESGPVTCDVRSALLGLVSVDQQQVVGAREAAIGQERGSRRHSGALQLVLTGDGGSVVPLGLREVKGDEMRALTERLNAFFADRRPGELPLRLYNWQANLVGAAMLSIGLLILISAATGP